MQNEIVFHSKLINPSKDAGFIYILSNPAIRGSVKVGKTTRLPGRRAEELSKTTSVPSNFVLEWVWFVYDDLKEIELTIHEKLKEFRVNKRREFFDLKLKEAIQKIGRTIDDYFSYPWGGIKYRKKKDAIWGEFFKKINIPFEYLTEPIQFLDGQCDFLPDFWLPDQDCFFIVNEDLLSASAGKMMAYCLTQATGKVVFQFWDCEPGVQLNKNGRLDFHTGVYVTPEGEFDGMVEWGVCRKCGSRHIGHLGSPELCDKANRNTSKLTCMCYTEDDNDELLNAYDKVKKLLGTS